MACLEAVDFLDAVSCSAAVQSLVCCNAAIEFEAAILQMVNVHVFRNAVICNSLWLRKESREPSLSLRELVDLKTPAALWKHGLASF